MCVCGKLPIHTYGSEFCIWAYYGVYYFPTTQETANRTQHVFSQQQKAQKMGQYRLVGGWMPCDREHDSPLPPRIHALGTTLTQTDGSEN